jgi:transposase
LNYSNKLNTLDFSGQSIYVGMDVHNKTWKLCIRTEEMELKRMTTEPNPEILVRHLRKNYPGASYLCAYEAGYCGFWIQHTLESMGVECVVVNPGDVPTTNKEKTYKTDPRDCRKIARGLVNGELNSIHVHSREELENRNLVRMRQLIVKKITRVKNQIKSLLAFYGISVNGPDCKSSWTKKHKAYLKTIRLETERGNYSLNVLIDELNYQEESLSKLEEEITRLSYDTRYLTDAELLEGIPGISRNSSMIWLTELGDIKRFKSLDQLCSFVGLAPSSNSSGESQIIGTDLKTWKLLSQANIN